MAYAQLTRRYLLRALHNLENPKISDKENEELYGLCYRLHGHDYKIMVTLESPLDPVSGLVFDRDKMDGIVKSEIIEKLQGKNLNDYFQNTSGEALVHEFFNLLNPHFPAGVLKKVAIQETRKNWFST
jgi:6-pyruvoyltetrahydropterin/6-carboxytetrahydropterin synthase